MGSQYLDRYQYFEDEGTFKIVPGVKMPIKSTDKYIQYRRNRDRLDKFSQEYYDTPLFGWLIMQANPLAGSIEFLIPDNYMIRVPFPLIASLQDYKKAVDLYKLYYGE